MKLQSLCLAAAIQYALTVCSTPLEPLDALKELDAPLQRRAPAYKALELPKLSKKVRGSMLLESDTHAYSVTSKMTLYVAMTTESYDKKVWTSVLSNVTSYSQKRSSTPVNPSLSSAHDNRTASTGDDSFVWTDHYIVSGRRVAFVVSSAYGSQNMTWPNMTDVATGLTKVYSTSNSFGSCQFQVQDTSTNTTIGIGTFEVMDDIPATAAAKQAPAIFNQTIEGTDLHLVLNTTAGPGKGPMNSVTMNEQLNDTLSIINEWQTTYNDEDFVYGGQNIWTWGAHSTPQEGVAFGLLVAPTNGVNEFAWSVLGNVVKGLQQGLVENGYFVAAEFRAYNKTGEFAAGGLFNRPPLLSSAATVNGL